MTLQRQHERGEHRHGPDEVLEVRRALTLQPVQVRKHEDHQAAGQGDVEVARRRREAGDEPQRVAEEDEEGAGADDREKCARVLLAEHVFEQAVEGLDEVLREARDREVALGHDGVLAARDAGLGHHHKQPHDEQHTNTPRVEYSSVTGVLAG
jgi:hypothetical protein